MINNQLNINFPKNIMKLKKPHLFAQTQNDFRSFRKPNTLNDPSQRQQIVF